MRNKLEERGTLSIRLQFADGRMGRSARITGQHNVTREEAVQAYEQFKRDNPELLGVGATWQPYHDWL